MSLHKFLLPLPLISMALTTLEGQVVTSHVSAINDANAQTLATNLVGTGVTLQSNTSHIIQSGTPADAIDAIGTFTVPSGNVNVFGITNGVILSSGTIASIQGVPGSLPGYDPSEISYNHNGGYTDELGLAGDSQLERVYGDGVHLFYDSTALQFSFIPTKSYITFQVVSASEEYDEYVGSGFNDIFAAFVNGSDVNCALLPPNNELIDVNSINANNAYHLYFDNDILDRTTWYDTEADGFTKVLTLYAPVNPGVVNTIKFVISDLNDDAYNSWALLQAGSFRSIDPVTIGVDSNSPYSLENSSNGYTINLTNKGSAPVTVTQIRDFLPPGFSLSGSLQVPVLGQAGMWIYTNGMAEQGDTLTVGSRTYTFRNLAAHPGEITIGSDPQELANNIESAFSGDAYNVGNSEVGAASDDEDVFLCALVAGYSGNSINVSTTSDIRVPGSHLSGGTEAIATPTLATTSQPDGSTLLTWTWSPGFSLPGNYTMPFGLGVTTGNQEGVFYSNVDATASVPVATNGDDGEITVSAYTKEISVEKPDGYKASNGSSYYFGDWICDGSYMTKTFRVWNMGSAYYLDMGNITVMNGASPSADFSVDSFGMVVNVSPGNYTEFKVRFKPTALGYRTAALHIATDTTSPDSDFVINLSGNAVGGAETYSGAYLKGYNSDSGDQFSNVAICGDTVVVGAPGESSDAKGVNKNGGNNNAANSGAAYVFVRDHNTGYLTQVAYLKASNAQAGDKFGSAVAVGKDLIVIGAPGESSNAVGVNAPLTGGSGTQADNSKAASGAAYVFYRDRYTGEWKQGAYLKASNPDAGDLFGSSVSIDLPYGSSQILVGAPMEASSAVSWNGNQNDNSAPGSGAAYVFSGLENSWQQTRYLKPGVAQAGQQFGSSVSITGPPSTGDSIEYVIGSPKYNSSAGCVFVYSDYIGGITYEGALTASNAEAGDLFGSSLAISGNTVVIGAPGEDSNSVGVNGSGSNNSASASGAAYVFLRSSGVWTQQAYLKASNTNANDQFGAHVAICRDIVCVGAPGESSSSTDVNGNQSDNAAAGAGAAYVFMRSGTAWTQSDYLKANDTGAGDGFSMVAVDEDYIEVGAPGEDDSGRGINGEELDDSAPGSGAVYEFKLFY